MSDETTTGADSAPTIPGIAPGWIPGNPGGPPTRTAPTPGDGPPTEIDAPALTPPPAADPAAEPPTEPPAGDPPDGDDDEDSAAPPVVPPQTTTTRTTSSRPPWVTLVLLALLLFTLLWGWWIVNRTPHPDPTAHEVAEIGRLVDGYEVHPGSFRDHRGTLLVDGTGHELRCQMLDADASGTLRGVRASCEQVSAPR